MADGNVPPQHDRQIILHMHDAVFLNVAAGADRDWRAVAAQHRAVKDARALLDAHVAAHRRVERHEGVRMYRRFFHVPHLT